MRFIIGMIIFWIMILGYSVWLKDKTKVKALISLVLSFSILPIIVYLAGLLNILPLVSYGLYAVGIILFIYYVIKKRESLKSFIDSSYIYVCLILVLFFSLMYRNMHPMHYDDFMHWMVIVKDMFVNNALPNFATGANIGMKSYQPGTACFIYLASLAMGKTEGVMVVAQNYIMIIFLSSLLTLIKDKNKYKIILSLLFITTIIFMALGNVPFYDLLVDSILAEVTIAGCVISYLYFKEPKKLFYLLIPVSIYLVLIKNSGMLFVALFCCLLLASSLKCKDKKTIAYAFYLGFIALFTIYMWEHHVEYVYGKSALLSPNTVNIDTFIEQIRLQGLSGLLEFWKIYGMHFLDITHNLGQIVVMVIDLLAVSMLLIFKQNRKEIILFLIVANGFYLSYYFLLGIMYILSTALVVASNDLPGFDRFIFTGVFIVVGMFIMLLYRLATNHKNVWLVVYAIVFIGLMLGFLIYKQVNFLSLLGKQNYESSISYEFKKFKNNINFEYNAGDLFLMYMAESENAANGYYMYVSRYIFDHQYTIIVSDVDELKNYVKDNASEEVLFVVDEDKEIMEYINKNDCQKLNENIYRITS